MKRLIMFAAGMGAILVGLPYILHAFGPTEAEVVTWGWVSVVMGAGLVLLCMGIGNSSRRAAKVILSIGYTGLALFQVLPILLWFVFHGSGISDGTPPSVFVGRWFYSLPHAALLAAGLVVLYQLWRSPTQTPADQQAGKHDERPGTVKGGW